MTPKTTINTTVVRAKKNTTSTKMMPTKLLSKLYKEKKAIKNLNFLIDLAMVSNNTKPYLKSPKHSTKPGVIPMKILAMKGKMPFAKNSPI